MCNTVFCNEILCLSSSSQFSPKTKDGEELEEDDGPAPRVCPNRAQPKITAVKKAPTEMRVVGAVKGMQKLVPTRPPSMRQAPEATRESVVEPAPRESDHPDPDQETEQEPRPPSAPKPSGAMPISPQDSMCPCTCVLRGLCEQ